MSKCSKHPFIRLTQGECVFCLRRDSDDLEQQLATANDEIELLRAALMPFATDSNWQEITITTGDVFGATEGDPAMVFDSEDGMPWGKAQAAITEKERG